MAKNLTSTATAALTPLVAIAVLTLTGPGAAAQETGGAAADGEPVPPALQSEPSGVIRVAGLVQFVEGTAARVESRKTRAPLSFQTPMYEGERFHVSKDSSLKFVSRSGCTAALYGESQILAPNREKPWRIKSEALRWICPPGSGEKIEFRGVDIAIDPAVGGEFLLVGSRILVLRDQVFAQGHEGPLPASRVLQYRGKQWEQPDPESSAYDVWLFNESKRPPKESTPFERPDRPITSRWILTPVFGRAWVRYDQDSLKQNGMEGGGARLQAQFRQGKGSLLFGISFSDARDESKQGSPNSPPVPGVNSSIESFNIDTGYRFSHDRWWSPYVRIGFSIDKSKVQVNRPDIGYYSRNEYEFYSLTGALGIDVMYRPRWLNWFGLYAAAEIHMSQSLGRGARRALDNNSWYTGPPPDEANEPWRLTLLSSRIMLGTMLQF